jgi:Spy/CpxP family protein refolding chaperone
MTLTIGKRAALFALIAGTALVAGIGAFAHEPGVRHIELLSAMTGDEIAAHADMILQRIYTETNATDAQKAQINPLLHQAVTDMLPMHSGARDFHAQALALLSADTIDRAALENLRVEHIQVADQASRRITQAIADIAEVLTPAQRKLLAAHVAEMHGLN